MGLGIFALINFTQPSNVHSVAPATPMPAPVASAPAAPEIDYGPYMANLQRTIKRNWFPPKDTETKQVVVLFKIDKAGQLSKLRLSRSSGVGIADQAALKAVEDASHSFKPLPEGAPADVDIEFTFDYNVFNTPKRDFSAEAAAITDTDSDSGSDSSSDSSSN
jgi:TonB family protein